LTHLELVMCLLKNYEN